MRGWVHWPQLTVGPTLPASASVRPRGFRHPAGLRVTACLALLMLGLDCRDASAQPEMVPSEPSAPVEQTPGSPAPTGGLITIESDTQSADNLTGVVTAIGNVRIVYPSRGMVATARQAQYFSKEGRLILSGDVDVTQKGGNALRAERVIYLLEEERAEADPAPGQQVFSQMVLRPKGPAATPLTP